MRRNAIGGGATVSGGGTVAAPASRTLTAGAGLTGGGDLTADRTFDVGAGDGIAVTADDVSVKASDIAGNGLTTSGSPENLDLKAEHFVVVGQFQKSIDGSASAVTAEVAFFENRTGVTLAISELWLLFDSSSAPNNTNNATFTIGVRDGAGGARAAVGAYTTDVASGGITAWTNKQIAITGATTLPNGQALSIEVTKAGSGVLTGRGIIMAKLTVPA